MGNYSEIEESISSVDENTRNILKELNSIDYAIYKNVNEWQYT